MPTNVERLKKKQSPIARPTVGELINGTPTEIIDRARTQCRPIRAQYAIGSKEGWQRSRAKFPTYYNEQRVYSICTDGKRYSYIRFFGPPTANTPAWVWCSCPYFKYYLEVALSYRNGSSLKKDRGPGDEVGRGGVTQSRTPVRDAPPNVRNPTQDLYLCKHLVVTAEIALRQTRDMASKKYEEVYGREARSASTIREAMVTLPPSHAPLFDL